MRISVDKRDAGYRFDIDLNRVRVTLDGVPVTDAVTADEELGIIVRRQRDALGKAIVSEDGRGHLLETVRGKVHVDIVGPDGGSVRTPRVSVERVSEGLQVMVYSNMRLGNIRRMKMPNDLLRGMSEDQLAQTAGVLAGAGAEHCCEAYGDLFDPSDVARVTMGEVQSLLARERSATRQ